MIIRKVVLIYTALFGSLANAAHVEPIFSGYWYTGAVFNGIDACSVSHYTFSNRIQGDAASVAQTLLGNVPARTDCEWKPVQFGHDITQGTPDFPGSPQDWNNILKNKGYHTEVWGRACKDRNGRQLDGKSVTLLPSYVCPEHTTQSFDTESPQHEYGCTTAPASCWADVMGRNLNVPVLGSLGHNAIALPGFVSGMVIEVLTEGPNKPNGGIFTDSMESFKNFPNSPYWGSKMGVQGTPVLNMNDAQKITGAATAQSNYPFEYSMTWDWHPGGSENHLVVNPSTMNIENTRAVSSAKFRCDSFVYYSYLAGAQLHIVPSFGPPDTPKTLFEAMLECRGRQGIHCGSSILSSLLSGISLRSTFDRESLDLRAADEMTRERFLDPGLTRVQKIQDFWALAQQNSSNESKYSYLLDSLAALHPIEWVPNLIQAFHETEFSSVKLKIVSALFSALAQNDIQIVNQEKKNFVLGQRFIRELLMMNQDKPVLRYILQMYPTVVTAAQADQDIELFFQRTDIRTHEILDKKENDLLQVRLAFANPATSFTKVLKWMDERKKDKDFAEPLAIVLGEGHSLVPDVKPSLRQFLLSQKENLVGEGRLDSDLYTWLNGYATVSVSNESEKDEFILNYIHEEKNNLMQAKYLSAMPNEFLSKMPEHEKKRFRDHFESQISSDSERKQEYQKAISRFIN